MDRGVAEECPFLRDGGSGAVDGRNKGRAIVRAVFR